LDLGLARSFFLSASGQQFAKRNLTTAAVTSAPNDKSPEPFPYTVKILGHKDASDLEHDAMRGGR